MPSHYEWSELERAVCAENGHSDCATRFPDDETKRGWTGSDEGTSLKTVADDKFSALLPGSLSSATGQFNNKGITTAIWSTTTLGITAWNPHLTLTETRIGNALSNKTHGRSVRCVKD